MIFMVDEGVSESFARRTNPMQSTPLSRSHCSSLADVAQFMRLALPYGCHEASD
jgi:hypothetical protein